MNIFQAREAESLNLLRLELHKTAGVDPAAVGACVAPKIGQNRFQVLRGEGFAGVQTMSNRSISMYEYRQVIMSLRLGESCRSIAKAGLIGRHKAEQIRQLAMKHDWLNSDTLLPDDVVR